MLTMEKCLIINFYELLNNNSVCIKYVELNKIGLKTQLDCNHDSCGLCHYWAWYSPFPGPGSRLSQGKVLDSRMLHMRGYRLCGDGALGLQEQLPGVRRQC